MIPTDERGPHSYEYLKSFRSGLQVNGGFECPFFSDAYFTGYGVEVGPYELINAGAIEHRPGYFRPAIVLRCAAVSGDYRPSLERTDTSRYHGGMLTDEIAALVSLCLGVRMQAGAANREFDTFSSPGRPIAWDLKPWPESRAVGSFLQVRSALESRLLSLETLALLDQYDRLSAKEANALIKAARTYQRALWIVEWDPAQAWLLFVSTIEALADYGSPGSISDETLLYEYHTELAEVIASKGGVEFCEILAPLLKPLIGSVRKFRGFIEQFFPDPPNLRPSGLRVDWALQYSAQCLARSTRIAQKHCMMGRRSQCRCVGRRCF